MKVIRSIHDFNDIHSIVEYEEEYVGRGNQILKEHRVHYTSPFSEDHIDRLFMEGVHIAFIHKSRREDLGYYVRTDGPYLQMHFEIQGEVHYRAKDYGGMDCLIPSGQHTLFYFPALYGHLTYPTLEHGFGVEIEITLTYLKRVFQGDLSILGSFADDLDKERPSMLGGACFPITNKMREILLDMYHCPFERALKKIFIEGKLLELLSLQVAQLTQTDILIGKETLRADERERMMEVKRIVETHLDQPYSIEELATLIGINRTKLQRDFKEVHGTTIFGYLSDLRMEKARELLRVDGNMKIAEIAQKVGYKNPNHFSTAYKKKFGALPRTHRF